MIILDRDFYPKKIWRWVDIFYLTRTWQVFVNRVNKYLQGKKKNKQKIEIAMEGKDIVWF